MLAGIVVVMIEVSGAPPGMVTIETMVLAGCVRVLTTVVGAWTSVEVVVYALVITFVTVEVPAGTVCVTTVVSGAPPGTV